MFIYSLFGLEIGVSIMIFDVIDVIFSEKLLIGESIGFSWDFCIYIGRKWFGLVFGIWIVWWTKVLILVGFDDIGCDMGVR